MSTPERANARVVSFEIFLRKEIGPRPLTCEFCKNSKRNRQNEKIREKEKKRKEKRNEDKEGENGYN